MKKLWILFIFIVLPIYGIAQQNTEYNRKGDEAMKRLDYSDAKMWYEEGVGQCNAYSINQLTSIWLASERMRPSMRSLMNKCLNCLNVMATENDKNAISQLIIYYMEGIGAPKSDELAQYWDSRLEILRKPVDDGLSTVSIPAKAEKTKEPMAFFVGYAYSIDAPYGLTVGGVGRRLGWYARFKTNASFQDNSAECNNTELIVNYPDVSTGHYAFEKGKRKINAYAGTAGVVIKATDWLYTSVGLGYGKHDLLWYYTSYSDADGKVLNEGWAMNTDKSYQGIVAELDVILRFGPVFVSGGCNTINFKYINLNAGLGVFF